MGKILVYKLNSDYQSSVFNSGQWVDGNLTKKLENTLKKYLKVKYLVLTNSGTSALLAAYWALKDRFKMITVDPYTFPASYQPAKILGYKVKFQRHLLTDQSHLDAASLNTIVHLYGQPNQLLAKTHHRPFIEDACQAFGAEYQGKKLGTFGLIGCFSFYPTKTLHACGHAGAVVTNDKNLYAKLKVFIESGRSLGKMTESPALNLRIDEIKAEYLLKELKDYEPRLKFQRSFAKKMLKLIPQPQPFLVESPKDRHIYATFNLLVKNRSKFRDFMEQQGIETLIYYGSDILPKNERVKYRDLTGSVVSLPCRWNLTPKEKNKIISALKKWFL